MCPAVHTVLPGGSLATIVGSTTASLPALCRRVLARKRTLETLDSDIQETFSTPVIWQPGDVPHKYCDQDIHPGPISPTLHPAKRPADARRGRIRWITDERVRFNEPFNHHKEPSAKPIVVRPLKAFSSWHRCDRFAHLRHVVRPHLGPRFAYRHYGE